MHKFQYKSIPEAIYDHFKTRLSHSRDGSSLKIPRIPDKTHEMLCFLEETLS